jgi:Ca2+-binding EF-hand superfamily protein/esterase/lipase
MKNKQILILTILLLLTACSQKTPKIDGQKNKFTNKFYPAKIDAKYMKEDMFTQKYPIIFMLGGYEGGWKEDSHIRKLQRLGYHVVSIAYYDDAGYSNNLAKVNIDDIKKIMDSYRSYNNIDTNSIGLIGRGKGAELALLMASYYPDIKMIVGISAPHVAFQASRATLATESSWTYQGKEVPFVAYPKLSLSAFKSLYRVIVQNDDYRDLHDLALENTKALEKARIEVENINGDIFLASVTEDKMWDSPLMGEKIMKKLKEKKFKHQYEHKTYRGTWFLRGKDSEKAWGDIYDFVTQSLKSPYSKNIFSQIDENQDKGIAFEEFHKIFKQKVLNGKHAMFTQMFYACDTNYNQQVDYHETRISMAKSYYHNPAIYDDNIQLPPNECYISQHTFKRYDLNSNKSVSLDEFLRSNQEDEKKLHILTLAEKEYYKKHKKEASVRRFKQCDKNNDSNINKLEATMKTCQINTAVFTIADSNHDHRISVDELYKLPSKYARFRQFLYLPINRTADTYQLFSIALAECDSNYNGKLDKAETTHKSCGFTEEDFLNLDTSQDGLFTYDDIELKDKKEFFKKIDTDNNEKLNFSEWLRTY